MIGHMPWISQESPSYIEKMQKNRKKDPFNRKKWNFHFFKSSIFYGTRFSQPKYHIPG